MTNYWSKMRNKKWNENQQNIICFRLKDVLLFSEFAFLMSTVGECGWNLSNFERIRDEDTNNARCLFSNETIKVIRLTATTTKSKRIRIIKTNYRKTQNHDNLFSSFFFIPSFDGIASVSIVDSCMLRCANKFQRCRRLHFTIIMMTDDFE